MVRPTQNTKRRRASGGESSNQVEQMIRHPQPRTTDGAQACNDVQSGARRSLPLSSVHSTASLCLLPTSYPRPVHASASAASCPRCQTWTSPAAIPHCSPPALHPPAWCPARACWSFLLDALVGNEEASQHDRSQCACPQHSLATKAILMQWMLTCAILILTPRC